MPVFWILEGFSFGYMYTSRSNLNIAENGMFGPPHFPLEMYMGFSSWDYKIIDLFRSGNISLECIIGKGQG